ncbi:MAG: ribose-5-phosphate isomerase RpiA [Pseudomonadota bacterium]
MAALTQDELKAQVGQAAADLVRDGMKLGIGTGSTAEAFIRALASRKLDIIGVPTSERTHALCEELGIRLTTLAEKPQLDMTIDGADEIDPALNLIKGAGGALLREKIVAMASDTMVVIADGSKKVDVLGAFPLPIEVNAFGLTATQKMIERVATSHKISGTLALRRGDDGKPYLTDGGHHIIDASFGRIVDPQALGTSLNGIPGVVEHGLFTGLASRAILATTDGLLELEPA